MPIYSQSGTVPSTSLGPKVSLKAGAYELRILSAYTAETGSNGAAFCRTGATISGGTVITAGSYREGAPAASASLRTGASVSGGSSTRINLASPFNQDVTISPGSALTLDITFSGGSASNANWYIEFEELLLSWHY